MANILKGLTLMNTIDFLKTLYLGDRYCTKMVINGIDNNFEIHINCISRIRDILGKWNFYTTEDIENGIIVIDGVKKIIFDQSGLLPNDEIYDIYAKQISHNLYEFTIEASHVDDNSMTHDLTIKVIGESVYLIDPKKPTMKIIN
ncbi:MAG: hypothetical protein US69_C0001G0010 [candidate division TM6 bacterium GW2011_GWF2_38_10]|nr:MAG: hypothetical protein US69_C0001G0010 [candidate division TM6 bacterium GW2011_GWF2_38_10]